MVNVAIFASGSGSNFETIAKADLKHANIKVLIVDKEKAYAYKCTRYFCDRADAVFHIYRYRQTEAYGSPKGACLNG